MARKNLIAGNWKMNASHLEAIQMVQKLSYRLDPEDYDRVDVVVCPPFTALRSAQTVIEADHLEIHLGAQNCHWEESGAFTGEISAGMLKEAGAEYVVIGHSERRRLFNETDATVNRKLVAALGADLTPIVCIGETLDERDSNATLAVLDRQIKAGLDGLTGDQVASLVLAYEPVWAIGTGRNASPQQAGEAHAHIRSRLRQWFGGNAGDHCHVIYGGSVKPDNIHELILLPDVDGALVGGASLDVGTFFEIVSRSRQTAV